MKDNNIHLTSFSKELRKNMTKEERHLWYDFLKALPLNVYRQHVLGTYIADFYIASRKLVIELDGSGHFEPEQQEYDEKRTAYLRSKKIWVLRYTNSDIRDNFSGVCEDILRNTGLLDEGKT